jgi:hypothetical protein
LATGPRAIHLAARWCCSTATRKPAANGREQPKQDGRPGTPTEPTAKMQFIDHPWLLASFFTSKMI